MKRKNSLVPNHIMEEGFFPSEEVCWERLKARDKDYADRFFYGVLSTRIYCRPGCSARLPLRKNVRFFPTCTEAEEAGYRACKKCLPHETLSKNHPHNQVIIEACRLIETSETEPTLADLAREASLSPHHFQRIFKAGTGLSPKEFALACRQKRVREKINESGTITEALYDAGYNSAASFYAQSNLILGMKAEDFKRGGRGPKGEIEMKYMCATSELGVVLIALTKVGIAAILIGDTEAALIDELKGLFPHAVRCGEDKEFQKIAEQVIALVEKPNREFDLPLDIRGTVFQQKVWSALRKISAGTTASYAEIAAGIGQPTAARAVARACASNRLAVAIPCHRVVRGDGSLSGYRWGVERKKNLLKREKPEDGYDSSQFIRFDNGAMMLPEFASGYDAKLMEEIIAISEQAGFRKMMTPWGKLMSVAITNCGEAGWVSDKRGYRYARLDPHSGLPWPEMPAVFFELARSAAQAGGYENFHPNSCLINRYQAGAQMGLHQDKNEGDFSQPIVSVSLGLPAKFLFGGLKRSDKPQRFVLQNGDVCVWGGASRLAYHGVDRLKSGVHALTGECRYNLTFRQTVSIN